MFEVDRIYGQCNNKTGLTEWFFSAREGGYGPFKDKIMASKALDDFVKYNISNGISGGRTTKPMGKLSLVPQDGWAYHSH